MCTLSVFSNDNRLIITMNRDEQRSRKEHKNLHITDTACFPVDIVSQGTWFGINKSGLVCALLNRYQDAHYNDKPKSRGTIIPEFLSYTSMSEAIQSANNLSFTDYNPFDFFVITHDEILSVSWDGVKSNIRKKVMSDVFFITSSSVNTADVLKYRHHIFSDFIQAGAYDAMNILSQLHQQKSPHNDGDSIFMCRDDGHTKSITQVIMDLKQLELFYWPENILNLNEPITLDEAHFHQFHFDDDILIHGHRNTQ